MGFCCRFPTRARPSALHAPYWSTTMPDGVCNQFKDGHNARQGVAVAI